MSTVYRQGPFMGLNQVNLPDMPAFVRSAPIDVSSAVQLVAQIDFVAAAGAPTMFVEVQDTPNGPWRYLTQTTPGGLGPNGEVKLTAGPVQYTFPALSGSYILSIDTQGLVTNMRLLFAMSPGGDPPGVLTFTYLLHLTSSHG